MLLEKLLRKNKLLSNLKRTRLNEILIWKFQLLSNNGLMGWKYWIWKVLI